ncbi:Regulatory-associated protein of TOR [Stylosanthes scabra]|uniref:Regulatory-associated protein of TOR n=1 Tax=Stylosanthes scabra TaxID=79078 RepID=A0ABU6VHK1_9FABA|nr:Regulatory-associated protein of TOR [Stylosanthes scabra]
MALGDSMASRFSQSTVLLLPNHLADDYAAASSSSVAAAYEDADLASQRRDSDSGTVTATTSTSASYGGNAAATSLAYLPQTVFLCELRHEAFEISVPVGPSESGLVSKWRPKDRVSLHCFI